MYHNRLIISSTILYINNINSILMNKPDCLAEIKLTPLISSQTSSC